MKTQVRKHRQDKNLHGHPSVLSINNIDGSPRWIWPTQSKKATFLEFYQTSTLRHKLIRGLIKLVFLLRIQICVFRKIPNTYNTDLTGSDWAIFTGTVGPNRKQVIIKDKDSIIKTSRLDKAIANIEKEHQYLQQLNRDPLTWSFKIPKVINYEQGCLEMEKLPNLGSSSTFTQKHFAALAEIRNHSTLHSTVLHWPEWSKINQRLNNIVPAKPSQSFALIIDLLKACVAEVDLNTSRRFSHAHGDFTPWNCFETTDQKLAIVDWELAHERMPVGYDFFHFHIQNGIMLKKKPWQVMYRDMHRLLHPSNRLLIFGDVDVDVDEYLKLYLIHHISYYVALYNEQADWHDQVYWQLNVWLEALMSVSGNECKQRKAMLSMFFDLIAPYKYAVLKLGDHNPLEVNDWSDIDVLVDYQDSRHLIDQLKGLSIIKRMAINKRSHMSSIFIVLHSGQTLSIDLIWKLKRKATVFLKAETLIHNAYTNQYNVRVTSSADNEAYIRLFYGLNHHRVPAKYNLVDKAIQLPDLPENKGLKGLLNKVDYLLDRFKGVFKNRGYIITFSGVDGAGKSTVIAQMAELIDKKIRRPVKVLRHRPSILPILSAYIFGKKDAEKRTLTSLPRTGANTSKLSSIIRFAYYYVDYLIGQWYVFFKYIVRGHVVIYDRYYYDFILDAKRSNIELPQWVSKAGFNFIAKPQFNFFLYADADVILSRKQELERSTITQLTSEYKSLFSAYDIKYLKSNFRSIENISLSKTLEKISDSIIAKTHVS